MIPEALPVLREILGTLKSIDGRLAAAERKPAPAYQLRLGRVFKSGDLPPADLDLVMADGGLRWVRDFDRDRWHPRDVDGPELAWNELLDRAGHLTEIQPPPSTEDSQ